MDRIWAGRRLLGAPRRTQGALIMGHFFFVCAMTTEARRVPVQVFPATLLASSYSSERPTGWRGRGGGNSYKIQNRNGWNETKQ